MKVTIHITKEILWRAQFCSPESTGNSVGQNCAVSLAIVDLFGNKAWVGTISITICKDDDAAKGNYDYEINMPQEATEFIKEFDLLIPQERLLMPELSFDIDIPETVIDLINIDEVLRIIEKSESLSLPSKDCVLS